MADSLDVSNLTAYVADSKDILLSNIVLGRGTRERISIQTGVKYKMKLHPLTVTPTFQSGSACGFSASGAVAISEREITAPQLKVNLEICPEDLVGKYAEYLISIRAQANPMPFEQYIMEGITNEINKNLDTLIWQGDTSQTGDAIKGWADGFLEIARDEAASVIEVSIASGQTAYQGIKACLLAIPAETLARGGVEIYVSPEIYRAYMQDLVAANLYHYNPGSEDMGEEFIPGSNVKVVSTIGLTGSKKILATFAKNLFYGTDLENNNEELKVWFSDDDDIYKIKAKWNSGMQIAFPDEVVLGTFAATPAETQSNFAALNTIATNTGTIAGDTTAIAASQATIATEIATIDTSAASLASTVNASNQIETVANTPTP